MSSYSVKITRRALNDMERIYRYIADELLVPDTAMQQYDRIAAGIESLGEMPHRCRLFASQPERQMGLRLLNVDNYAVIFVISETAVTVLRVLYSHSDLISRLRDES